MMVAIVLWPWVLGIFILALPVAVFVGYWIIGPMLAGFKPFTSPHAAVHDEANRRFWRGIL